MKQIKHIAFSFVLLASMIIVLHSIVPHHHTYAITPCFSPTAEESSVRHHAQSCQKALCHSDSHLSSLEGSGDSCDDGSLCDIHFFFVQLSNSFSSSGHFGSHEHGDDDDCSCLLLFAYLSSFDLDLKGVQLSNAYGVVADEPLPERLLESSLLGRAPPVFNC